MSDQGFREIQLTGKQLVFLFMASVVVAVAIFLLGVSVGRGVRGTTAAATEAVPDATADDLPVTMPPATVLTPADRSYHDQLQGQSTPPAQTPPAPPPQPAATTGQPAQSPAATPEGSGSRQAAAPARTTPAAGVAAAPAPAVGGWFVQVGAFGTRANAERRVAELKAKGHAATIATVSAAPAYRVRLGPFAERAGAERLAARVKAEGFESSVYP